MTHNPETLVDCIQRIYTAETMMASKRKLEAKAADAKKDPIVALTATVKSLQEKVEQLSFQQPRYGRGNFNNRGRGSFNRGSGYGGNSYNSNIQCYNCGRYGHFRDQCNSRNSYRGNNRGNRGNHRGRGNGRGKGRNNYQHSDQDHSASAKSLEAKNL